MSTKSSIYYAPDMHIYEEGAAWQTPDPIDIEVYGPPFVSIRLPLESEPALLKKLRERREWIEKGAAATDEEIESKCRADVAARVKHRGAEKGTPGAWLSIAGFFGYGSPNDPEEMQIASGIEYAHKHRARCREVMEIWRKASKDQA